MTANITVDLRGLSEIGRLNQRLQGVKLLAVALTPVIQKQQEVIQTQLQTYPPPLANSRYVRTFKLKNSWKRGRIEAGNNLIKTKVYSDGSARNDRGEDYSPFVMDELEQADIHRGRWRTVQDIGQAMEAQVVRPILVEAVKFLRGMVAA